MADPTQPFESRRSADESEGAGRPASVAQGVLPTAAASKRSARRNWLLLILALAFSGLWRPGAALAVPAYAEQTGQPCAACHVGAFGPQLKPYGRDFKLHGYVASDGQDHGLPLAITALMSFTHTLEPQPGGAAPGFAANDNLALDQASLYYAGRITPWLGAFVQVTYEGVDDTVHIDNTDIRHASEGVLFGHDLLWGVTANNSPTVSDAWNSTPVWGFPYNSSPLAPGPTASTLIDGQLGQRVAGAGAYMLWNDLVYAEFDAYGGLDPAALKATGIAPSEGPRPDGLAPYGRLAVVEDWKQSHLEIGAYGMTANVIPAGLPASGSTDQLTDLATDATYQYIFDPSKVTSDMISAHATVIHEWGSTPASEAFFGALPNHWLTTARADVSYSFAATITPSLQIFQTTGSADPAYWATPNGSPDTRGMIMEIAYVPWGKPDSPVQGMNARLAVQYVDYFCFDGSRQGASRNNSLYVSLWTAVRF